MGIIFKQLSIPPVNNSNLIETLKQHQKRLTIYNLLQTLNSLNALNECKFILKKFTFKKNMKKQRNK